MQHVEAPADDGTKYALVTGANDDMIKVAFADYMGTSPLMTSQIWEVSPPAAPGNSSTSIEGFGDHTDLSRSIDGEHDAPDSNNTL